MRLNFHYVPYFSELKTRRSSSPEDFGSASRSRVRSRSPFPRRVRSRSRERIQSVRSRERVVHRSRSRERRDASRRSRSREKDRRGERARSGSRDKKREEPKSKERFVYIALLVCMKMRFTCTLVTFVSLCLYFSLGRSIFLLFFFLATEAGHVSCFSLILNLTVHNFSLKRFV